MASSQRLVRVDLNEQAYGWLRERIVTRAVRARRAARPTGLADELGVSRSPVHQALTRLVSEGLVTVSRRGYAVRPVTTELVARLARRPPRARGLRGAQRCGGARAREQLAAAPRAARRDARAGREPAVHRQGRVPQRQPRVPRGDRRPARQRRDLRDVPAPERAPARRSRDPRPAVDRRRRRPPKSTPRSWRRSPRATRVRAAAAVEANVVTGRRLVLAAVELAGGVL